MGGMTEDGAAEVLAGLASVAQPSSGAAGLDPAPAPAAAPAPARAAAALGDCAGRAGVAPPGSKMDVRNLDDPGFRGALVSATVLGAVAAPPPHFAFVHIEYR